MRRPPRNLLQRSERRGNLSGPPRSDGDSRERAPDHRRAEKSEHHGDADDPRDPSDVAGAHDSSHEGPAYEPCGRAETVYLGGFHFHEARASGPDWGCGRGRGWPCGRVTQHTTYASAYAVPSVSIEQDPRTDPHTEPVRSVGPYTREEGGASGSDAPAGRCLAMSPGFEASLPPLVPCRILGAVHRSGRHGRGSRVRWAGRHEFHLRGYCGVDVTCLGCLAR